MDKQQWHPAFCGATELEFKENKGDLIFVREYHLSKKPLQMDMLIVKKQHDVEIKSEIGKIFRQHNIIEYKGEGDSLSIDDFYKVFGYACIYKSLGNRVNEIPGNDITVTFIRHSYPRELFSELLEMGIDVEEKYPGIYYTCGNVLFPVQFIITKGLDQKHAGLKILTSHAAEQDIRQFLMDTMNAVERGDLHNIDAVLQVSVSANNEMYEKIRGDAIMCEALRNLMRDEIDKEIEEKLADGEKNIKLEDIRNIMESFKVTAIQAMDSLKIPLSEREFYQSKL